MTLLELLIERPVAGGRMLGRHEDRVVFVRGAIPGERVRARVERARKGTLWADTVEVLDPSADRRAPLCDPECGGSVYAHIGIERQRSLKAEIIADAFRRIGKTTLAAPVSVAVSPEDGYRLRARLHVSGGRWGFVREGTHVLCDAAATRQLLPATIAAIDTAHRALALLADQVSAIIVAENVAATERVIHFELVPQARWSADFRMANLDGITGLTAAPAGELPRLLAGIGVVSDQAHEMFGGSLIEPSTRWRRHATSFFQGNRYLLGALVQRVLDAGFADRVVDLYAGVGLFSVALAARGARVSAVEGDRSAAADLQGYAVPFGDRLEVKHAAVEDALRAWRAPTPEVVILDPPRTGLSPDALAGVRKIHAPRIVYVSCDPPTLARDSAQLAESGYQLRSIEAFDLFPNTAHVECVAVFVDGGGATSRLPVSE